MLKETLSTVTELLESALEKYNRTKLADEIQHVQDSLFFATTTDNELEGAVAICNALELFQVSPNYAWCMHDNPDLDTAITDAERNLDMRIQPHVKEGYLQLEDCYCNVCGDMTGLYSFGQETDKRINNKAVYEFMWVSNMCDGCWQNKFWCPEEV